MKTLSSILIAASVLLATTSASAAEITLKLASFWPKGFPIFGTSTEEDYTQLVSELSDGRIEIVVHTRNKHKGGLGSIFDFVKTGQYDLGQSAAYYHGGKDPNTLFFTTMPFGMTSVEQYGWFYEGGGLELANEVYGKHGIEVMPGGNTGMQMGGWFRKEINSIDDLKGLKMRIPGYGGKVYAEVGGVVTNLPPGELYQALERGTIDALEWVGPSLDLRMGFHKVAPYYYTGWHEPSTELMYFFNKKKMDTLPAWATAILRQAAKLTSYNMFIESTDASAKNWATMKEQYPNIKVRDFPADVIEALRAANKKLLTEAAAKDPMSKRIIDSRAAYLAKVRQWTEIGEKAYLNAIVE